MKFKQFYTVLLMVILAASAFASDLVWKTDISEVKQAAQQDGKYTLINFTGSDWCPWCFKLRDEVFKTDEFKSFASESLILMEADFPKRKSQPDNLKNQNRKLAGEYGVQGFPTVALLSPKGDVVALTGYKRGGSVLYIEHLKDLIKQFEEKSGKEVNK